MSPPTALSRREPGKADGSRARSGLAGAPAVVVAAIGAAAVGFGAAGCTDPDVPVTEPRSISVESPFRYPVELWDRGLEGETIVMVHVTDVGGVDSVYVLQSSGEAAFDSAALAGARDLRFAPARRGDERIATWARLPVRFSRTATRSEATP